MSTEELTPAERAALRQALDRLPTPPGPGPVALLARPRRTAPVLVGLAAAAAALLVVQLPGVRDKGLGGVAPEVSLRAVAEGPAGIRALTEDAAVHPGEWVVFQATASAPGTLRILEGDTLLAPAWEAETAGASYLGGAEPLAYRPDDGELLGARRYVVELCSADHECVTDVLTLRWVDG